MLLLCPQIIAQQRQHLLCTYLSQPELTGIDAIMICTWSQQTVMLHSRCAAQYRAHALVNIPDRLIKS